MTRRCECRAGGRAPAKLHSPPSHQRFTGRTPTLTGEPPTLRLRNPPAMEPSAAPYAPKVYVESPEVTGGLDVPEGIGLGTLLILLSPFALAAWFAIGSAVYRVVT